MICCTSIWKGRQGNFWYIVTHTRELEPTSSQHVRSLLKVPCLLDSNDQTKTKIAALICNNRVYLVQSHMLRNFGCILWCTLLAWTMTSCHGTSCKAMPALSHFTVVSHNISVSHATLSPYVRGFTTLPFAPVFHIHVCVTAPYAALPIYDESTMDKQQSNSQFHETCVVNHNVRPYHNVRPFRTIMSAIAKVSALNLTIMSAQC